MHGGSIGGSRYIGSDQLLDQFLVATIMRMVILHVVNIIHQVTVLFFTKTEEISRVGALAPNLHTSVTGAEDHR